MSPELIAILGLGVTVIVALLGGGAWILRRVDERFDKVDRRFENVDRRFDKVDARFERVDEQLLDLRKDLAEVKVAVARLEGPRSRFIAAR